MSGHLHLSLPDELQAFVNQNSGPGTPYPTASEFVLEAIRERMLRAEAERIRQSIVKGYQDAIAGRVHEFNGDLQSLLDKVSK